MPMQRQTYVAVWLRLLAEKEIRTARAAKKLFVTQGKAVKAAFNEGGQLKAEQVIKQGVNDWAKLLIASYSTVVRDFAAFAREQLTELESKANFLDLVSAFISREGLNKSSMITNTTLSLARQVIVEGVRDGKGEAVIARMLQVSIGGNLSNSRARTIARTEVHNAATFGMQAQAEQTQIPMRREWVSVHDDRTRDTANGDEFNHAAMDTVTVGMDEQFAVPMKDGGFEYIDRPGEGSPGNSINCRCVLRYIPQDMEF